MQAYSEAIKSALRSLRANKLRSFLTILGVVIGTFAVIGLVSIVSGLKAEIKSEVVGLGAEMLDIIPQSTEGEVGFGMASILSSFEVGEVKAIRKKTTKLEYLSEIYQLMGNLSWVKNEEKGFLIGVTSDYFKARGKREQSGRLFTKSDSAKKAKVIVLGDGMSSELFGRVSPLGKTVKVNGEPFEVIGVFEKETMKMGNLDINKASYIPASTTERVFPETKIREILAKAKSPELVEGASREVERILREERKDKDFSVLTQEDMIEFLDRITQMISIALAGVASISLLVGGIGIMNIMLVSVTERTKEIGLRKAVGAEDRDILAQFLIEAVILCLLGGLIGIAIAEASSFLVTKYTELPSLIDPPTILAALGFSVTVGLIFGTAPAIKASKLDPIEALRHE